LYGKYGFCGNQVIPHGNRGSFGKIRLFPMEIEALLKKSGHFLQEAEINTENLNKDAQQSVKELQNTHLPKLEEYEEYIEIMRD
jgi:hypothetical protein